MQQQTFAEHYRQEGIQQGMEQGMQQGRLLARKDTVLKLHQKGHSVEQIGDLLDIPYVDVQKIIDAEKE